MVVTVVTVDIGIRLVQLVVMVTGIMVVLMQVLVAMLVDLAVVVALMVLTEPQGLQDLRELLALQDQLEHRVHRVTQFRTILISDISITVIHLDQLYKRLKKRNEHSLSNFKSRFVNTCSSSSLLD
jgi:hypothetical protein